ncbi:Uncharacterized protein dnm_071580 [Desulfonema magnum]|uniref:Uncharacterized protein n=1 Tax=Desulfonema magnum TaxID=45655 RepID=A0A975GSH7_9BACT|nr:Uncharacterized protein dnm_071580 [Desulfonema magnum]
MNRGETRLFPSAEADHSGKKAGFLSLANIENLWLGTYYLLYKYSADRKFSDIRFFFEPMRIARILLDKDFISLLNQIHVVSRTE